MSHGNRWSAILGANYEERVYEFLPKIIEAFEFEGLGFYRLVVTVMRCCDLDGEDMDVDVAVYVTNEVLEDGYIPEVGDDVNGLMWMQGRIA